MQVSTSVSVLFGVVLATVAPSLGGQQSVPPVFFNHVVVVLPSPVYAQLLQSPFLKNELGAFSVNTYTAQSDDRGPFTYTGIYIRGQHTYFELFESDKVNSPGSSAFLQAGVILFNMWLDNRAQLPAIRDRAAAEIGTPMEIETVRNPSNLPSFDMVRARGSIALRPGIAVSAGIMAYYPDGITREKKLEGRYLPDRLLQDLGDITVTVNGAEAEGLLRTLRAYGYAIRKEGETQIAVGPEMTFKLLPEKPHAPRILAVDLSLNRETTSGQTYRFADGSELHLQGRSAKWTFTFASK